MATEKISTPFLHDVKELQLQNGLRTQDYKGYRQYLSGRIRTLRKQLSLSSEYKEKKGNTGKAAKQANKPAGQPIPYVSPKPVVADIKGLEPRHILLAALLAERAWAEGEEAAVAHNHSIRGQDGAATKSVGIRHAQDAGRRRFNKAAKLAQHLMSLTAAVGDEALIAQGAVYYHTMLGRAAAIHERHEAAKAAFITAREHLVTLHRLWQLLDTEHQQQPRTTKGAGTRSNPAAWVALTAAQIVEADDRIVFAMMALGEDVLSYQEAQLHGAKNTENDTTVSWLGRGITVKAVRLRELLREVNGLGAEACAVKLFENVAADATAMREEKNDN